MPRYSLPVIDSHAHAYSYEQARDLASFARQEGLAGVNIACIAQFRTILNAEALKCKADSTIVYVFGGLIHENNAEEIPVADFACQARELIGIGIDGFKMLEAKPDMRKKLGCGVNDSRYDTFYKLLEEKKMPILMHVADPEEFWNRETAPQWALKAGWTYDDPSFTSKEQLYEEALDVARRYPTLNITFAHFFFLSADRTRAADVLERYPNVRFDITPGIEMYRAFAAAAEAWKEFFTHFSDRIILGTDNVVRSGDTSRIQEKIEKIRRFLEETGGDMYGGKTLGLDEDVCSKIYARNFRSIVAQRRNVDRERLTGYYTGLQNRLASKR